MSSSADHLSRHPVASFVARMREELTQLQHTPVWSMSDDETRQTLAELTRLVAQASSLELKVAIQADRAQVGDVSGATSAGVWWANHTRMTQRDAHRKVKLAKALERHELVAEALAAGEILVDQAQVIVDAVDALPDDLDPDIRVQARDHLLEAAKDFDAKALRIQGRRILDVVAPEVGEAEEAKRLAAEERRAEQAARLTMHDDGHGQTHGRFTIPTGDADMFRKALHALASPKAGGTGLSPHGMGLAFVDYIRRYPTDRLPYAGGVSASVVVLMDYDTLMGGLKVAQLDTGTRISPGHARKLACEAGIIPVVLDGDSQPLDVGRQKRFHTKAQRIAMLVRDRTCVTRGCERPASACHAHHLTAWADGGHTTVKDGVWCCPRHHTLAHHADYHLTRHPDGTITFTRRE